MKECCPISREQRISWFCTRTCSLFFNFRSPSESSIAWKKHKHLKPSTRGGTHKTKPDPKKKINIMFFTMYIDNKITQPSFYYIFAFSIIYKPPYLSSSPIYAKYYYSNKSTSYNSTKWYILHALWSCEINISITQLTAQVTNTLGWRVQLRLDRGRVILILRATIFTHQNLWCRDHNLDITTIIITTIINTIMNSLLSLTRNSKLFYFIFSLLKERWIKGLKPDIN